MVEVSAVPIGGAGDRPVNPTSPGDEYRAAADAVKEKRGRGRPKGSGKKPADVGSSAPENPAPWDPAVAGLLLKMPHDLAAGITGFAGFCWEPAQVEACQGLLASILDEALPYQGYRVKLVLLVLAVTGIDAAKFRAYRDWRAAAAAAPVEQVAAPPEK